MLVIYQVENSLSTIPLVDHIWPYRAPLTLPSYLYDAPESIQREFIEIYLRSQGQRYEEKATVHFREERSMDYLTGSQSSSGR